MYIYIYMISYGNTLCHVVPYFKCYITIVHYLLVVYYLILYHTIPYYTIM